MNKKKKRIIISILVVLIIVVIALLVSIFGFKDNYALTLSENKWLDTNKHNVVDMSFYSDVPILSYDGEGLVYDYLDYMEDEYSLKFNVVPYKMDGTSEYNYKMSIVDSAKETDIVLLKDNLVLITNTNKEYKDIKEIQNLKIGVLASDRTLITNYLNDSTIEFIDYNSYSELKSAVVTSKINLEQTDSTNAPTPVLDGIIVLKTLFTKEMIENSFNISYQFNDLNKYFILTTNGNADLNNILRKSYGAWKEEYYETKYNENLLESFYEFNKVSDVDQKTLKSKSYVYGFIDYGIYNNLQRNKIDGLSGLILKDFNKFSGLSITYTQYNSMSKLLKDFNSYNVDFMLNIVDSSKYLTSVYNTNGVFDKNIAIVSGKDNKTIIDGIKSLKDKEVLIVKDTYLENYLTNNGARVKSYNNMKDLASDFDNNDITLIDIENYNYYKSSDFEDSRINYVLNFEDKYTYVINDTEQNKIFEKLFNFYINFNSINSLVSENYNSIAYENINIVYILVIIIIILLIYLFIDFSNHIKVMIKTIKKNKKVNLSKEDKIKYIDQLTSLKNRAYLNSRIESWDDSEVYPQSIIIIDLNNVSYINDNYGREEGDKVITEAANVLIQNQLQNSEIIRTDGNEFLIYLVGYNEKQIISYLRKLNKELKGLSHGFGAASGYSIITDAIKTVDDAVNEATLDMKNNKEDLDY